MRGIVLACVVLTAAGVYAGVGDPQTRTDHPWYPGELSCSTWDRLFRTQADLYTRITGRKVQSEEEKALASWFWRNLNYSHAEEGLADLWDQGFGKGIDATTREYWTGLFAHGFGLCFATHAQWHGEMAVLLGPGRSRVGGVAGHTTFEVFLTGGAYGQGRWALLDHDISTVIFTEDGSRLMDLTEVAADPKVRDPNNLSPQRQRGWRAGGLHPDDPKVYAQFNNVHYASGYAAVPPLVHLRPGETLRRYPAPGLEDGKTFIFWGRNYKAGNIPGPERSRTWVNQPDKMHQATRDCGYKPGQSRYGNAVYVYKPDFVGGKYKEGITDEGDDHVTLEFYTPYVIAGTPPNDTPWGIYADGCTGGLVLTGKVSCPVSVSTDQGKTWQKPAASASAPAAGAATGRLDLTDLVKGHQQYLLRLDAPAKDLAAANLTITTVCQCNPTLVPHVQAGANKVWYEAGGRAFLGAGPNLDQANAHVVDGKIGTASVTLELSAPRKAPAVRLYAASRQESSSPPRDCAYNIEYSTDGGKTFRAVVKDWKIIRRKPEPDDFWSQSFCWGDAELEKVVGPVRVRFTNDGGRNFQKVEAYLVYEVRNTSPLKATYAWKEGEQVRTAVHTYPAGAAKDASWSFTAGPGAQTFYVEYAAE